MNKPKFRAWLKSNKAMYGVYGWDTSNNEIYLCSLPNSAFKGNGLRTVRAVTRPLNNVILMQYTGLKDKNGVEIYEGDVVKVSEHPFDNNGNFNGNYEVEWDERDLTYLAGNLLLFRLAPYIEVIGSIHENPELLNEAGK